MADTLIPVVGSTDWAGGRAPVGGIHTGTTLITMKSGATFVVAASRAEVLQRLDLHAVAQTSPTWVAFDQPSTVTPVILNTSNIQSIA